MSIEESNNSNHEPDPTSPEDTTQLVSPLSEQTEGVTEDQDIVKDDPQPSDTASRELTSDEEKEDAPQNQHESADVTTTTSSDDDISDADSIRDDDNTSIVSENIQRDWSNEKSTRAIAIELKHIETDIRKQLEDRDTKRKRKLAGSRRWQELEEDLISWKFSGRVDDDTIQHLQRLVARRNHLFTRLRFLASTRPTWNS